MVNTSQLIQKTWQQFWDQLEMYISSLRDWWIVEEKSIHNNIFIRNITSISGNHSYFLLLINFEIFMQLVCIFIYQHMYAPLHPYIYILLHLHMCFRTVCSWYFSASEWTSADCKCVNLEMYLGVIMKWIWRCTW